jgi:hypothetical protein
MQTSGASRRENVDLYPLNFSKVEIEKQSYPHRPALEPGRRVDGAIVAGGRRSLGLRIQYTASPVADRNSN